jgi:hypothetical protein
MGGGAVAAKGTPGRPVVSRNVGIGGHPLFRIPGLWDALSGKQDKLMGHDPSYGPDTRRSEMSIGHAFDTPHKNIHYQPDDYVAPKTKEYQSKLSEDWEESALPNTASHPGAVGKVSNSLKIDPANQVKGIQNQNLAKARKKQGGITSSKTSTKKNKYSEAAQGTGLHT